MMGPDSLDADLGAGLAGTWLRRRRRAPRDRQSRARQHAYTFDPATGSWAATPVQGGDPGTQASYSLVDDVVDDGFIFVTDYGSGANTWADRNG